MALSYTNYTGDGSTTDFNVVFDYIARSHVLVFVDDVETDAFEWLSDTQIRMDTAPALNAILKVKRSTPRGERLVNFTNGSTLDADTDLDVDSNQLFYLAQEAIDSRTDAVVDDGSISSEKLAPMARYTVKGRSSSGTGIPQDVDVNDLALIADGSTTRRDLSLRFAEVANVKDFGATGDGTTNDTVAIQAAIDSLSSGGTVYFPRGTYRVARTIGTSDRYGLKVTASNIRLEGDGNVSLRRLSTNITALADAYPILFIGTPDSNVASATQNIHVVGLKFVGESTRHANAGAAEHDFRCAVELKNTNGTILERCRFEAVDSAAVFYQYPAIYDGVATAYYNTTCNYNTRVVDCDFVATSHATAGRALIHALDLSGVTNAVVNGNRFEWCDVAINGDATFNDFSETDASTWTPTYSGWALGAVKRIGRNWVITGNVLADSTENSIYCGGMDCSIEGNTVRIADSALSGGVGIKIRARGASVSGNRVVNFATGISVNEPALNVTVSGNSIYSSGTETGGAIDINTDGISTYIANRVWFATDYKPMSGIVISDNAIEFPTAAASSASHHSAFRLFVESSDANYPNGQLVGVTISGNTAKNFNTGVFVIGTLLHAVAVSGNTFSAKPFTRAAFAAGTTLNTRAAIQVNVTSSITALQAISFTGNVVDGASHLIASTTGAGSAGTLDLPFGVTNNTLNYIKDLKTADMKSLSSINRFTNNTGTFWLDRTFDNTMIQNSLGDGVDSATELKHTFLYDGSVLRFYTDDSSTYLSLS